MKITKTTLQFVILHEAADDLSDYTLLDLLDECNTGRMIRGSVENVATETFSSHKRIEKELLAVGNDGTFFDME